MRGLRHIMLASLAAIAVGCATTGEESKSGGEAEALPALTTEQVAAYDAALKDTNATWEKSLSTGYAWTQPEEMLEKAAELIKKNDFQKAMKLLAQAKSQSEQAIAQAEAQKTAGPRF